MRSSPTASSDPRRPASRLRRRSRGLARPRPRRRARPPAASRGSTPRALASSPSAPRTQGAAQRRRRRRGERRRPHRCRGRSKRAGWQAADPERVGSGGDLGVPLRRLHDQPLPPFSLPALHDPLAGAEAAVERHPDAMTAADRARLLQRIRRSRRRWAGLQFPHPPRSIPADVSAPTIFSPAVPPPGRRHEPRWPTGSPLSTRATITSAGTRPPPGDHGGGHHRLVLAEDSLSFLPSMNTRRSAAVCKSRGQTLRCRWMSVAAGWIGGACAASLKVTGARALWPVRNGRAAGSVQRPLVGGRHMPLLTRQPSGSRRVPSTPTPATRAAGLRESRSAHRCSGSVRTHRLPQPRTPDSQLTRTPE